MSFLFAIVFSACLVSCGGDGGGGGSNSIGNAAPLFSLTGGWSGSYQLPSGTVSIVGTLTNNGNQWSGSFTASNGATLVISGQVSGTAASFSIISNFSGTCQGNFTGTGTLSQPQTIDRLTFSFSGSDCNGAVAGIPGSVTRTGGALGPAEPIAAYLIERGDDGIDRVVALPDASIDSAKWSIENKIAVDVGTTKFDGLEVDAGTDAPAGGVVLLHPSGARLVILPR